MADRDFGERPMTRSRWSWPDLLPILLGFTVLGLHPAQARAQCGIGYGWRWGGTANPTTQLLTQHALQRGAAALQSRPSRRPYANTPNAYFNRLRDNGFVSHYDVRRHRPPTYQPAPT